MYLGLALLGPVVIPRVSNAPSGASIRLPLQPSDLAGTSGSLCTGGGGVSRRGCYQRAIGKAGAAKPATSAKPVAARGRLGSLLAPDAGAVGVPLAVAVAIAALSVGATVIGTGGVDVLLERPFTSRVEQLAERSSRSASGSGFLRYRPRVRCHKSRTTAARASALSVMVLVASTFFALGTRRMALIPALVAVGVVLARPERKGAARVFFIGIL